MTDQNLQPREWSADEIRRVGYHVVDTIAEYLAALTEQPVFRPVPAGLAARMKSAPWPEHGEAPDAILDQFREEVAPYPMGNGHPRFAGWVNSPPAMMGVFAEALAAAMNPSCAGGNHAAIHVERQVLDWFKQMLGFPPESAGLLVSGGSLASLIGLAVARHVKAGFDVRRKGLRGAAPLAVYATEEGHSCLRKAVEILGLGSESLRHIPLDDRLRMRPEALEAQIVADRAAGIQPVAVAASAGTVNTGAIDPLRAIAEICRRHGVWFHVDGAYGAPAILSRQYRDELAGLALADSVTMDPHKWLCIPVEAGLVLVRDAAAMRDAFSLVPPYLRTDGDPHGVGGLPWFSEFGIQQTRGFRALKVWMALKHAGLEGYRALIDRNIEQARYLFACINDHPELEAVGSQSLSIVCFRYAPEALRSETEQLNQLNQALLKRLQLGGEVFLTSTVLKGVTALRACIVNYRTRQDDLDAIVGVVARTGRTLLSQETARK